MPFGSLNAVAQTVDASAFREEVTMPLEDDAVFVEQVPLANTG